MERTICTALFNLQVQTRGELRVNFALSVRDVPVFAFFPFENVITDSEILSGLGGGDQKMSMFHNTQNQNLK